MTVNLETTNTKVMAESSSVTKMTKTTSGMKVNLRMVKCTGRVEECLKTEEMRMALFRMVNTFR